MEEEEAQLEEQGLTEPPTAGSTLDLALQWSAMSLECNQCQPRLSFHAGDGQGSPVGTVSPCRGSQCLVASEAQAEEGEGGGAAYAPQTHAEPKTRDKAPPKVGAK